MHLSEKIRLRNWGADIVAAVFCAFVWVLFAGAFAPFVEHHPIILYVAQGSIMGAILLLLYSIFAMVMWHVSRRLNARRYGRMVYCD